MLEIQLHENWYMSCALTDRRLPAKVPGSVYADLMANGLMDDPYYRDNELKALELMENDFTYETTFAVPQEMLQTDEVILHFDGLDTIADIYLNGQLLGHCENMHRVWEFSVKEFLRPENNELKLVFSSPTEFIRKAYETSPIEGSSDAMRGFPHLRKAHCMFGWDWGARLPDAGIWRGVKLLGVCRARIDGVYITQTQMENEVLLDLRADIRLAGEKTAQPFGARPAEQSGLSYRVTLTAPDGSCTVFENSPRQISIRNPQIWWPNGYGAQPLYTIAVELVDDGGKSPDGGCSADDGGFSDSGVKTPDGSGAPENDIRPIDVWQRRIGLRTVTVSRDKDEWGEEFCFRVNGVRIFAMGADYIPEDSILPRCSRDRTYRLLSDAAAANYNTVRVWGGGHYPEDWFYDACDELGLLVWQDFMFACASYELSEDFEENVRQEFIDNIKRLRHHASLALWCGNNEIESFAAHGVWTKNPRQKAHYLMLFEYIIPKVLKEYDPNTFFWPSSPSSGGSFDDPGDENRGDVHYWDVWHGNKPITEYRKFYFRFVSEFGFQSFPSLPTCETFTLPEDRNIFSYVMEKHQRNASANAKIMSYMGQTYLYPTDFDTILYASQLLQADAIRYGVEHFRRNRGRCMGTVVWQLNDCWPVASWASIDYFGRWKALHYYEKRMFAPILLSCDEEGVLTQDANPNAQPYEVKKSIHLNVSNETMEEQKLLVRWALRNAKADILRENSREITVPALSAVWLDKEDCADAELYEHYVSYELLKDGQVLSMGTALFTVPKYFRFADPHLTAAVSDDGCEIIVRADAFARSVELHNSDDTLILEDNYFDMNAGERRVKILRGRPDGLKVRSVFDIR